MQVLLDFHYGGQTYYITGQEDLPGPFFTRNPAGYTEVKSLVNSIVSLCDSHAFIPLVAVRLAVLAGLSGIWLRPGWGCARRYDGSQPPPPRSALDGFRRP
jgi:hypothetical protein